MWILSHLAKGAVTRELHTLGNKNTLKDLNDLLFWANMNNRRTRGRWAQIFSELREEDLQWMLDRFISKEVVVETHRCVVLPLPGIRDIRHFESCDNLEENKPCLEKRTMALMCMTLGMTECMTLRKCSENGKTPSAWVKTLSPLTDSTLDMAKVTKNG